MSIGDFVLERGRFTSFCCLAPQRSKDPQDKGYNFSNQRIKSPGLLVLVQLAQRCWCVYRSEPSLNLSQYLNICNRANLWQ